MKTLLALLALATAVPALASDVTSFYHSPYAARHAGQAPVASSVSFYRSPYAQAEGAAPGLAARPLPTPVAAARLAPPPKA